MNVLEVWTDAPVAMLVVVLRGPDVDLPNVVKSGADEGKDVALVGISELDVEEDKGVESEGIAVVVGE